MRFVAYDLALQIISGLREPFAIIRRHDAALAKQGRDAVNRVGLNTAEANGRSGGDRTHHFRIALGSLREVGAVLDIAAAHGWLDEPPLASAIAFAACSTASSGGNPRGLRAPFRRCGSNRVRTV